ncbi:hypothetical protein ACHAP8_007460 [Fusarium lateritium]
MQLVNALRTKRLKQQLVITLGRQQQLTYFFLKEELELPAPDGDLNTEKQRHALSASEEDAWKRISHTLKMGNTTAKIFNHYVGKAEINDLTWGHVVVALILFGKATVRCSAFGKKAQIKFPRARITTMAPNNDGQTLTNTTLKKRGRQSSKAPSRESANEDGIDDEDLLDEELSDKAMEDIGESDSPHLKSPAPSQENNASSYCQLVHSDVDFDSWVFAVLV